MLARRSLGIFHHGAATGGVDGHDRWLEHMDRLHCRSDSVGNIVELEIEEDRQAQFMDLMYPMVAMGAEEFEPQLEAADVRP
jgi:hypothetical protein